jgi:predicted dithiol-disulfide oxidoreductase (DUF899 family)
MNGVAVQHETVSAESWAEARKALLAEEKALTRQRDDVSRRRRELPWVKVEKKYEFEGSKGRRSHRWNSRASRASRCHARSGLAGSLRGDRCVPETMGWRFKWVSSFGSEFNFDYHVSFTKEELANGKVYYNYEMREFPSEEAPGASVFYKDPRGNVFHTYSAYARGLDILLGAYNYLDLTPKGRDEDGLAFTMSWIRHHDRYEEPKIQVEEHCR